MNKYASESKELPRRKAPAEARKFLPAHSRTKVAQAHPPTVDVSRYAQTELSSTNEYDKVQQHCDNTCWDSQLQ